MTKAWARVTSKRVRRNVYSLLFRSSRAGCGKLYRKRDENIVWSFWYSLYQRLSSSKHYRIWEQLDYDDSHLFHHNPADNHWIRVWIIWGLCAISVDSVIKLPLPLRDGWYAFSTLFLEFPWSWLQWLTWYSKICIQWEVKRCRASSWVRT